MVRAIRMRTDQDPRDVLLATEEAGEFLWGQRLVHDADGLPLEDVADFVFGDHPASEAELTAFGLLTATTPRELHTQEPF